MGSLFISSFHVIFMSLSFSFSLSFHPQFSSKLQLCRTVPPFLPSFISSFLPFFGDRIKYKTLKRGRKNNKEKYISIQKPKPWKSWKSSSGFWSQQKPLGTKTLSPKKELGAWIPSAASWSSSCKACLQWCCAKVFSAMPKPGKPTQQSQFFCDLSPFLVKRHMFWSTKNTTVKNDARILGEEK